MNEITSEKFAKWRRLASGAKLPWIQWTSTGGLDIVSVDTDRQEETYAVVQFGRKYPGNARNDATYIAEACNNFPALIDELERALAQLAAARAALEAVKAEMEQVYSYGKVFRNGELYYDPMDLLKQSQIYQTILAAVAAMEVKP